MQHFDDYQLFTDTTATCPPEMGLAVSTLGMIEEIGSYSQKLVRLVKFRNKIAPKFEQIGPYNEFKEIMEAAVKLGLRAEAFKRALQEGKKQMPNIILFSADERDELVEELGDIEHCVARNARHLQVDLSHVAYENVRKTGNRTQRGAERSGDYI